MASSVTGIPTTRVSNMFIRQRLLSQTQSDQVALYRLQMQIATGRRYEMPSEEPVASLRAMGLQRLIERKTQVAANLAITASYLSNTDATLATVSSNMANIRAAALGVVGTIADDEQRMAAAQQVSQALRSLVDTGNQNFRGRYIFAGTLTSVQPFTSLNDGLIRYDGNEGYLQSYADIDLLTTTNLTGTEVFGAMSDPVRGTIDLNPVLTFDTRISDLRGGQGISKGSIQISDGTKTSTIDLSGAKTIGEMAALIKANPPEGRELYVEVTSTAIRVQLAGSTGNLSIREVGGGTVAWELGILNEVGAGLTPITGRDLDPIVRDTTSLDNVLCSTAWTVLHSPGLDNDVLIRANVSGDELPDGTDPNNLTVSFVADTTIIAGNELVVYDPVGGTLVVHIDESSSTARNVINAINARADVPYTASVDRLDNVSGGLGVVMAGASGTTDEGRGTPLDKDAGLRIVNQNDVFEVAFSSAKTVGDLLNTLNGLGAGLLAEINDGQTRINLRSRVSGCDFMIGENGGLTATQLGLRTFTEGTRLEDLNYGFGVHVAEGTDFTITIASSPTDIEGKPIPLEVDISGMTTIREVITHINSLAPGELEARLAEFGNGIVLIDTSSGPNTLKVERTVMSKAAIDLGLIPEGQSESGTPTVTGIPEATLVSGLPHSKSNVIIRAVGEGPEYNGVQVIFDDGIASPAVDYDPVAKTLTFGINSVGPDPTISGLEIIQNLAASPAGAFFIGDFDPTDGSGNDGTGGVTETDSMNPPEASGGSLTTHATVTVVSTDFDNDLIFTANNLGALYNGTKINFVDNLGSDPPVVHSYTPGVEMTIHFDSTGAHAANDIMFLINTDLLTSPHWTVTLDPADESPNDGSGLVDDNTGDPPVLVGGEQNLDGRDVHKLETKSMFTALIRLQHGLEMNDVLEVQRAIEMLDSTTVDLNFARAELGTQQQTIDLLQYRIETEGVELQTSLSLDLDADFVKVVSDLSARQVSFEASLKAMSNTLRMSLLDYL